MANTQDIVARATADLQRARSSAAKAREALARAEADASDLEAFLRTFERYAGGMDGAFTPSPTAEHGKNANRNIPQPGSRARDLVDTAIETIRRAGRPVMIGELLDAVNAAGFTLGGADHKSNLAGYLSRDPRVESRGRTVGWIVIEDEEAASEPASDDAASSTTTGGTNERTTLADPDDFNGLLA